MKAHHAAVFVCLIGLTICTIIIIIGDMSP